MRDIEEFNNYFTIRVFLRNSAFQIGQIISCKIEQIEMLRSYITKRTFIIEANSSFSVEHCQLSNRGTKPEHTFPRVHQSSRTPSTTQSEPVSVTHSTNGWLTSYPMPFNDPTPVMMHTLPLRHSPRGASSTCFATFLSLATLRS